MKFDFIFHTELQIYGLNCSQLNINKKWIKMVETIVLLENKTDVEYKQDYTN